MARSPLALEAPVSLPIPRGLLGARVHCLGHDDEVPRRPAITQRQAEIDREPDVVFRWWTAPARVRALHEHWEHLDVSNFTWHEHALENGDIESVEASWRTRTGIDVSVRRSFVPTENLRHSSHTVRQSRHPDGCLETAISDMTVEFNPITTGGTLVRLTNVWEATGLRWWQRLPTARLHRRDHIDDHLKDLIRACLRDTDPGRANDSNPYGD